MAYESQIVRDTRIDLAALLSAVIKRLPRIVLITLVLLGLTYVILMFMPRLYESSASILVEPRSNIYTRAANEQAPVLTGSEAGVVSSQIELIKSRDTLLRVIDRLNLRSEAEFNGSGDGGFSPLGVVTQILGKKNAPASIDETVLNNLISRMTVIQERDSRIISILVRSTDPQRAAEIANAIANAHVTRRAELSLSDTAEASGWLRTEIERLRVEVTNAETAVANFKINNGLFVGTNNTSLSDQQLSTVATQINAAQENK
ncbi:MAG TPA: Wzz/FepE/Etk N-terminal domain-containing protein, partial [Devosia sp.]